MNINQIALTAVALDRCMGMPKEGPKCVPVPGLDFTAADSYTLQAMQFENRGFLGMIQSVFIDTSGSTVAASVIVNNVQTITAPPGTQGFYPILVPNPVELTFSCPGGPSRLPVVLINFPICCNVWGTSAASVGPSVNVSNFPTGFDVNNTAALASAIAAAAAPQGATATEFSQASTNVFVDVAGSNVDLLTLNSGRNGMIWTFKNTGVGNSINVTQLGWNRVDGVDAFDLTGSGSQTVAAGAFASVVFDPSSTGSGIPRFAKLQVKSTVAGLPGTITGGFYAA
jgi:hypothetical protein